MYFCVRVVGITDYKEMFKSVESSQIYGISTAQTFTIRPRAGASASETGIDVHYMTSYHRGQAWYFPMPASPVPDVGNFNRIFQHPTEPEKFGIPISCRKHFAIQERGCRRQWRYEIHYALQEGGHTFTLPCPSLPFEFSRDDIVELFQNVKRQQFKPKCQANLEQIRGIVIYYYLFGLFVASTYIYIIYIYICYCS